MNNSDIFSPSGERVSRILVATGPRKITNFFRYPERDLK
jgi:hypothetical protein